jgi:5-(carboxyamino)imidazole ribonucleotide mutase
MEKNEVAQVGIVMGSISDWGTMKATADILEDLGIPYEKSVISAHRTPHKAAEYFESAENRGLKIIIAAAGGAAHLAGVAAALTHIPVLGVPMSAWSLDGLDSLLSMVQMPAGIPVPTLAIGKAGAKNAALSAAAILALSDSNVRERLLAFRAEQTATVEAITFPED